ncbi:DUF4267 domain-containing protein [Amycolatopsis sp. 195334CR]|uniref:DUF4267 domain-containing protein n=1 Tax=Amycolatopsis sp. 195334CR TaxID=2814588 RepID=UPI001A8F17C8|nr:DUF4267 domain-containing protein [Amycolatopsis sp. 195334CR]MBN6036823.1 DUF4267 domain-containing protein [Amycolatopsis sp. 195334CR]
MGRKIANGIALLVGLGIIYVGANFLLAPVDAAAGYGVAAPGDEGAYFSVKGIRDIASGLVVLTLLALGQRRALGWVLLAMTIIPLTDGFIVLSHGGSAVSAFGWHFSTATLMLVGVSLFLKTPDAVVRQPSLQRG